jgi:ankyrin repeat protein
LALINAGADLNFKYNDGSTPLHAAAFFCRPDLVKILLDDGADKNTKNTYQNTPLESVSRSFNTVKTAYEHFNTTLGPLGLELDYEYITQTRPKIEKMLK